MTYCQRAFRNAKSQSDYLDFVVTQVHWFSITKPVAASISGSFIVMFRLGGIVGTQTQDVPERKARKLLIRNNYYF